jgi:hypothetical protein
MNDFTISQGAGKPGQPTSETMGDEEARPCTEVSTRSLIAAEE